MDQYYIVRGDRSGVFFGVERIRALGNAVVPQQAYPIFRALAEELNRRNDDGY